MFVGSFSEAALEDEADVVLSGTDMEATAGGVVLGAGIFTEQAGKPNTSNPAKSVAFFMGYTSIKVITYLDDRPLCTAAQSCDAAISTATARPGSFPACAKVPAP